MKEIDRKDYAIACMQLNVILSNLSEEDRTKIPHNILSEIKKYKSNKYVYKYDFSKPLLEQEMLPLTKELLYYIYTKYLKTSNKILEKDTYSNRYTKDIFKRISPSKTVNEEVDNNLPIENKEKTFFQKIIDFLKKLFKTN